MSLEAEEDRMQEVVGMSDGGYILASLLNDHFLDRSVGGHQGFVGDHCALDTPRGLVSRTPDGGRFLHRTIAFASLAADSSSRHSPVGCWEF